MFTNFTKGVNQHYHALEILKKNIDQSLIYLPVSIKIGPFHLYFCKSALINQFYFRMTRLVRLSLTKIGSRIISQSVQNIVELITFVPLNCYSSSTALGTRDIDSDSKRVRQKFCQFFINEKF